MGIDNIPDAKLHEYWLAKLRRAHKRLNRDRKQVEWAKWASLANVENYMQLSFTEPARRDFKLEVLGERPTIKIETWRQADRIMEAAQTKLCDLELGREENWKAVAKVVDDAGLAGIGWLRADWYTSAEDAEDNAEDAEAKAAQSANQHIAGILSGAGASVAEDDIHSIHVAIEGAALNTFGLTSSQQQALKSHIEEHEAALPLSAPAGFVLSRIHPANMLWDDTADDIRYMEWIAERSVERLEDVKANKRYSHTANLTGQVEVRRVGYKRKAKRVVGTAHPGTSSHEDGLVNTDEDKWVVLWHIHNLRTNQLIVVCETSIDKKPLLVTDWPYPSSIYYPLVFDEETDGIEGISDYKRMYYPCVKRADIQERWLAHLDIHSRRKIIHEAEWADAKGMEALKDPKQTCVEVASLGGYRVLEDVPINPDSYRIDALMKDNINRSLGTGEAAQGVGFGANSATEAGHVDAARGRVLKDRRERVAAMLKWVCTKILEYYREFGTERLFLERGISPENDLVLDPSDIVTSVTITVDTDATSAANQELDRQQKRQAIELINASPWMIELLGTAGRVELMKAYLRSQNIFQNPDAILRDGAQEMLARGTMMPPLDKAVRQTGQTGQQPGTVAGQMTGNVQQAAQAGAVAPGMNRPEGVI